ncbi:MAG: YkgJ family cysteine cluster protein [Desulfurivibrionaceae bacterium]
MECRKCGACCIAPSINSPITEMPEGKSAGVACVQLTDQYECAVYGCPERPIFCRDWQPLAEICGSSFQEALRNIEELEIVTYN